MVRKLIQFPDNQARELEERAKKEGISFAELIRRSADDTLSKPIISKEMRERAMNAVGFAHGGPPDLSVNHDKYLAEDFEHAHVR